MKGRTDENQGEESMYAARVEDDAIAGKAAQRRSSRTSHLAVGLSLRREG